MKKTLLAISLFTGLAACVYGQGVTGPAGSLTSAADQYGSFSIDNYNNVNSTENAASSGLVWLGNTFGTATLLNQDINIAVYDGSSLVVALLLTPSYPNGPAAGDGTTFGGGEFVDTSSSTYYDTLAAGGATRTLTLDLWTGSATTYANVVAGAGIYAATATFSQPLGNGGTPASSSTDFTGMPAMVMLPVPEPTTLALAGLGGAALLAFRRRKV
jgi:hypothetical protein